jgi:hypothetical protein
MDCLVPNCKCYCHIKNPQEINIKELMIEHLEKEAEKDLINQDYDDLWARRVRLHKGEETPLTHDDYKNNFTKLSEVRKQLESFDFDKNQPEKLSTKPNQSAKINDLTSTKTNQYAKTDDSTSAKPNQSAKINDLTSTKTNQYAKTDDSTSAKKEITEQKSCEQYNNPFPKPIPLNPLHKYKVAERDNILREVYLKALSITKMNNPKLDIKSKEFNEIVKKEADNQLEIWFKTNK